MKLSKKTLENLIRNSNAFITRQALPKYEYTNTKQFEADIQKSPLLGTAMSTMSLAQGQLNYKSGEQNAKD